MPIRIACENVVWEFKCSKNWEDLTPTENPKVRACDACQENVYFCASADELNHNARKGFCVAFNMEPEYPDYDNMKKPGLLGRIKRS